MSWQKLLLRSVPCWQVRRSCLQLGTILLDRHGGGVHIADGAGHFVGILITVSLVHAPDVCK